FPDRQHLAITQQHRQSGVFDITRATEAFEHFTRNHHCLFGGRELHDRSQHSQQQRIFVGNLTGLALARQLSNVKRKVERRFEFCLQRRQRVPMQSLLRQRRTKRHSLTRIIETKRESTTHERHSTDTIPQTRDVQERRDIADTVSWSFYELRRRSV